MSPDRRKERADMEARRKEFDEAVNDLRRAKDRLLTATDLYLERLEGTRRDERHP
jgi:hypothetical protein